MQLRAASARGAKSGQRPVVRERAPFTSPVRVAPVRPLRRTEGRASARRDNTQEGAIPMAVKKDVFPAGDYPYLAFLANAAAFAIVNRVALHLTQAQVDSLGEMH